MNKLFFIAEIGINHNGDMDITKKLIDVAVEAGCDAVKFQKRKINSVYTQEYLDSPRESSWGTTQREQKEGLEFEKEEYDEIDLYCKEKNILWSASAWDVDSQIFLQQYNLPFNKIASAMLTYTPLLEVVAAEKKHTFISTGMSTHDDIRKAVGIFEDNECPYTLMHCVSTYPCKDEDCNLNSLYVLQKKFNSLVGYSGHEKGILPSLLACVIGASAIERHITLDKEMYGSDQSASLEPQELNQLLTSITSLVNIFGNGEKVISKDEAAVAKKLRYWL